MFHSSAFRGLELAWTVATAMLPLGIWKLVEIIVWLSHHVRIE